MGKGLNLTSLRPHTALAQLAGMAACLPPLVFPSRFPAWVTWGSLVGLLLIFGAGYLLVGRLIVRTPLDVPILLLLLLMPVTLVVTPDRALTLLHVSKVIGGVALFYGVVGLLEEKSWFGLTALTISAVGLGLAVLILFGTRWSTAKLSWLSFDLYQFLPGRIRPFWKPEGLNSNVAGGTLAMLLPVPVAYLLFGHRRGIRLGALLTVGTVSLVLLLTQSRGAISALLAGAAVMLAVHGRRWLLLGACLVVAGVVVFQSVADSNPGEADLYGATQSVVHSAQGRMELWSRGLMMLQDFPFTGIGLGMVVEVMPLLYPTFVIPNDARIEHVHNLYLEAGVDLGFPGLIVTLGFLLALLYFAWQAARCARGKDLEPMALAMLGTVVAYAAQGLIDDLAFSSRARPIVWALFGVVVAVGLQLFRDEGRAVVRAASRET